MRERAVERESSWNGYVSEYDLTCVKTDITDMNKSAIYMQSIHTDTNTLLHCCMADMMDTVQCMVVLHTDVDTHKHRQMHANRKKGEIDRKAEREHTDG